MQKPREEFPPTIWPPAPDASTDERVSLADCWWPRLFAAIDASDAEGFASFLANDVQFRFGNAPPLSGRRAVRASITTFFKQIDSCSHRLTGIWQEPGSFVCDGEVTYTRVDLRVVTLPFVITCVLRGEEISSYRIYVDNGPLVAP
jgi:ketosteroid isomerase-like protein